LSNQHAIIDLVQLHELFISGKDIGDIADELGVSESVISKRIRSLRQDEPEKWPIRKSSGRKPFFENRKTSQSALAASFPPLERPFHKPSPEIKYTLSREEIDRLYPAQKPSTNSDGKAWKPPVGTFSDGRSTCQ
jgi:hypothetical protein